MPLLDINTGLKQCTFCKESKTVDCFGNTKSSADKLTSRCKICKNAANRLWESNNKDKKAAYNAQWQKNNPEKMKAKKKRYRSKPENHKKIIAYNTAYEKNRLEKDANYKLAKTLRTRINRVIKKKIRPGSADLGCTLEDLKQHLEKQFDVGMTWDNHGEWELDHIIPLSLFDLTDREQFLKACHYTNLQPLWWQDNLTKSNKLDWSK